MNIKILCSCGTKYAFDVEPQNGSMPAVVNCPACGIDGTEAANEHLRQALGTPAPTVRRVAIPPPITPPPPVQEALENPPPTAGVPSRPTLSPTSAPRKRAYGEPNLALGTAGAVGAAFLGMMIWYLIIKATNTEYGIIAWAVGGLTGFGCRTLGGGYSQKLGFVAAACAFVAIVGGGYLATRAKFVEFLDSMMADAYVTRLEYAQKASQLETDDQIRRFLAEERAAEVEGEGEDVEPNSGEALPVQPESITPDEIKAFRGDLPELKEFVNGKPTKAVFESELRRTITSGANGLILQSSLSLWTILWLILGVGSAYRLGVGDVE